MRYRALLAGMGALFIVARAVVAQEAAPPISVTETARAALLVGVPKDENPAISLGSAVWSIIPPGSGQSSTPAVRVEIDVSDQKMHATITIRKNSDAKLPATHTIDVQLTFADGAEIKGFKDMALPKLRDEEAPKGEAISGALLKIDDGRYLVGLTRSDAARNVDLLATHNWFDFPLLLNDDRVAKLTFERGAAGDLIMSEALSAWNSEYK
jgi:hypothetical protein